MCDPRTTSRLTSSDAFDLTRAIRCARKHPKAEIVDLLLDQTIFAGVGNIIKNEVLFRTRTSPFKTIRDLSPRRLRAIVADARAFSFRFLDGHTTAAVAVVSA
jgi:endonuclease-8